MQALSYIASIPSSIINAVSTAIGGANPIEHQVEPTTPSDSHVVESTSQQSVDIDAGTNTVLIPHNKEPRFGMRVHNDLTPLPLIQASASDLQEIGLHFARKQAHVEEPRIEVWTPAANTFDKVHYSYPFYLFECFANHYGAVITPDVLWFTSLITFAKYIDSRPEASRHFFADFAGKREIHFLPERAKIDTWVGQYLIQVQKDLKVPSNLLFPTFTTSTPNSKLAMQVAICDLVSPYYQGGILSCGIPHITVDGTVDDYEVLKKTAEGLASHFAADKQAHGFFQRIANRTADIVGFLSKETDGSFLHSFFECKNCASGHPVYKVQGWITEFMTMQQGQNKLLLKDYGLNCAMVQFDLLHEPGMKLMCAAGVFNSSYDKDTNTLLPKFDRFWVKYRAKGDVPATSVDSDGMS
jgi:Domain of unknown function (DUF4419)